MGSIKIQPQQPTLPGYISFYSFVKETCLWLQCPGSLSAIAYIITEHILSCDDDADEFTQILLRGGQTNVCLTDT